MNSSFLKALGGLMKHLMTLCFFFTTLTAIADVVRSPVHSVEKINHHYLIKFQNGRVGFLPTTAESLPNLKGIMVEAKLDKNHSVLSFQSVEVAPQELLTEVREPPVYEPTIIANLNEATKIFNRLNPNYKRASECFNRAHVWASEEFKKNNIKSLKVFVLFTASYINRVRFKWWFHVAPMILVQEDNLIEKRVLDFTFGNRPLTVKEWTDQLVFSKRPCLPTNKFSEYDVNPQTEDCYLMESSMYEWMPTDLQAQELQNRYKTQFYSGDIRAAYSEAF
jgi:hypothetical protein